MSLNNLLGVDKLTLYLIFGSLVMFSSIGDCLLCFECKNPREKGCGEDFDKHDIPVTNCSSLKMVKCAIQRQPPSPSGWVGISRICYEEGTIPGLNSSNGCRHWTNPENNYTAHYCFCDTDYCNFSNATVINKYTLFFCMFLYHFVYSRLD